MKSHCTDRRRFLATSFAATGLALTASRGLAHTPPATFTLPEDYLPVEVELKAGFAPGEIHVNPDTFRLYWTLEDNRALRYTVGVGRGDLYHDGEFFIGAKKEWPSWTPTKEMIARDASYAQWKDGMPGGINNPLGARALYLFEPGRGDTFLRIHGTNLPQTIGTAVSNGCVRLINDHIIDLYERIPMNTRVVLYPKGGGLEFA